MSASEFLLEHVSDIMFDGNDAPDPECSLCRQAVEAGVWKRFGVEDPFAPDEDES